MEGHTASSIFEVGGMPPTHEVVEHHYRVSMGYSMCLGWKIMRGHTAYSIFEVGGMPPTHEVVEHHPIPPPGKCCLT